MPNDGTPHDNAPNGNAPNDDAPNNNATDASMTDDKGPKEPHTHCGLCLSPERIMTPATPVRTGTQEPVRPPTVQKKVPHPRQRVWYYKMNIFFLWRKKSSIWDLNPHELRPQTPRLQPCDPKPAERSPAIPKPPNEGPQAKPPE
ncbi:hypothetical protein BS47DRAFT_1361373 [Hydnum rufescens UP504]|uniref:Uncharacterized protein n=1 Tax=Hydnum rufescens UP504 TaxID=1448309 RepID=A0A9P6AZY2_9AGAM|nr:hypothetical protein BS47DRAFT_1361373 [Hydnum rufescens UP504]